MIEHARETLVWKDALVLGAAAAGESATELNILTAVRIAIGVAMFAYVCVRVRNEWRKKS